MLKLRNLKRWQVVCVVVFCFLLGMPAYAYGDPTGGTLFQLIAPMIAVIWGIWTIGVNIIRRHLDNLLRKVRGMPTNEPER